MPILRNNTLEIISRNAEQTLKIGYRLGQLLTSGDTVCLHGGLGAGKTTLTRGIGQGWQSVSRITSPTYTLVNVHERATDGQKLYHVDAYRLENPEDLDSVGFEDIFESNSTVIIEWPERLGTILPKDYLNIYLDIDDEDVDRRVFTIEAVGERYNPLLDALRHAIFGV